MRRTTTVALALLMTCAQEAAAWDPFEGDVLDPGPVEPAAPLAPADPAPFVVPAGIYLVTEVYTGDVVTTSGPTTTYATTTVQQTPGTYARVIDVVGTGSTSTFDGTSFNGRAQLPDGRPVAGSYYQDFVLTPQGYVAVNIVFFQDDSLTRAPAPSAPAAPAPLASPYPFRSIGPEVPAPAPHPTSPPATPDPAPTAMPEPRTGNAAVALSPAGPSLSSLEVLRGRPVRLWLRAFVAGVPVPVRSWRMVTGYIDETDRRAGGGADPCEATWLTLAPPGTAWSLRFEVTSDAVPGQVMIATIAVTVRSPALIE